MWGRTNHLLATTALCCAVLSLTACWDDDNDHGSSTTSYTVGGTLSGLGSGLLVTLLNNGANALARTTNGNFTFSTALQEGAAYSVTVGTQPAGQSCTVGNGSGTMGRANVTSVTVTCADLPRYSVSGTVTGLNGGLSVTLLNNGTDALIRNANGAFTFATPLAGGAAYAVTVGAQPTGQTCTVSNGSGTIGSEDVANVGVACTTNPANSYTVGGAVSGLGSGLSVTLRKNGTDPLIVNANGAFTFATPLASGSSYVITVGTQPTGQTCTVSNGSGTIAAANVTNVGVTCAINPVTYTVGGTISGLGSGLSLTLWNNGGDPLTRNANGAFVFTTPLASGAAYAVTVRTQPTGQTCTVSNGSGTVATANVTNVGITCTTNTYTVGGTLSGLATGLSVTLRNNGVDALTRSANGAFTFATPIASGAAYAVTVATQPTGQTCVVGNGSGTIVASNVTNVDVMCASPPPWAWQGGSKLVAPAGVYGAKGTPSPANAPGGRNWNGSWVDPYGQFWIFGGQGYDAYGSASALNDLWRYDRLAREWTWMSGTNTINGIGFYGTRGVPGADNVPGAREFMTTWVDDNGDFWLFGGYGFDGVGHLGYLNDVWRYQPATNLWTWMEGSNQVDAAGVYGTRGVESATNHPGARWGAVAFQFGSGNLYLFGGYGVDSNGLQLGYLNDLWKFNPANGRWTWISGSNTFGATGVYGTKGVAAAANVPGARNYTMMVPTDNAVWIFGGLTVNASNVPVAMNDLWRYDIANGLWTWVSGANVPNSPGVYGTKGTPAASNVPGARAGMVGWAEPYIWIFGGAGYDSVGNGSTDLNDLWRFDPQTGHWTWMGGSDLAGAKGVYGTLGVPSNANVPGARDSGTVFYDEWYTGHAWLFGGAGYDSTGVYDAYGLNDLWELVTD